MGHHSLEPPDTVQLAPQGSSKPSQCLTPQLSPPRRARCLPCSTPKSREGCSSQGLQHWHCHPMCTSGQALPMPPSSSTHPCGTELAVAASRGSAHDGDPQPRWGYPPGRTAMGITPQFPLHHTTTVCSPVRLQRASTWVQMASSRPLLHHSPAASHSKDGLKSPPL